MVSNKNMWRFASNGNACEDGLNDAGIETFSANRVEATIRETIQNVIDQRTVLAETNNLPVIVEFDDFEINAQDFPGHGQFKSILEKCILSSENDSEKKF